MPSIKIAVTTKLSANDCFSKVSKLFETDVDLKKLDPQFKCAFDSSTLKGTAEGKLFKAKMAIQAKGEGSSVELEVDLPFHLALAKGMVQKTLEKKLAGILG